MPSIVQTWTTERVEALKIHFQAGLSCREIAAEIGVSRNAVIGKISRLNLIRDKGGMMRTREEGACREPAAARRAEAAADPPEDRFRATAGAQPIADEPIHNGHTCSLFELCKRNLPLADLDAGTRGLLLLRQHRRSRACPIAPATAGWRIG